MIRPPALLPCGLAQALAGAWQHSGLAGEVLPFSSASQDRAWLGHASGSALPLSAQDPAIRLYSVIVDKVRKNRRAALGASSIEDAVAIRAARASNVASLEALLGLDQASRTRVNLPASLEPAEAAARLANLRQLLLLQPGRQGKQRKTAPAALAQRLAGLIRHPPDLVRDRFKCLMSLLHLPDEEEAAKVCVRNPFLLSSCPESLAAKLQYLQGLLQVESPEEAAAVARRHPNLLLRSTAAVTANLAHLQQILGGSPEEVIKVCRRAPVLLALSKASLASKLDALHCALGSRQAARELVAQQPVFLGINLASFERRWATIQQLAASHPKWQKTLEDSPMTAMTLCSFSDQRLMRLQFLAEQGAQDRHALTSAMKQYSDVRFYKLHPEYEKWLSGKGVRS